MEDKLGNGAESEGGKNTSDLPQGGEGTVSLPKD